jgi:hypothetical protein
MPGALLELGVARIYAPELPRGKGSPSLAIPRWAWGAVERHGQIAGSNNTRTTSEASGGATLIPKFVTGFLRLASA